MNATATRRPLPDQLPAGDRQRAVWIGYEASFPFDPLVFLECDIHVKWRSFDRRTGGNA